MVTSEFGNFYQKVYSLTGRVVAMKRFSRFVAFAVTLCMVCGLSLSGSVGAGAKKAYVKSGVVYDMPDEMEVGDEETVNVVIRANCKTKAFGKFKVTTDDDDVVDVSKVKCAKPGSKGSFKLTAYEEGTAVITVTTIKKNKKGKRLTSDYEIEVTDPESEDIDDDDDWDDDDDYDDDYDDDDYDYDSVYYDDDDDYDW
jgi:hypothetical protein